MKKNNELVGLREELSKVWNERMTNFCIKKTNYIKINNLFVGVCDAKPTIKKEIYYNDEYEAPKNNKTNFLLAQENSFPKIFENSNDLYLINQYTSNNKNNLKTIVQFDEWEVKEGSIPVTDEMLEEINKVIEKARAKFSKRLESYYKRYSDKISVNGYWANR